MVRSRRWQDDGGAVAVMVALLLVVLVLMTGFVLDLGMARFDRHDNQTAADLAVTAAVNSLDTDQPNAYQAACETAVDYFVANNPGIGPGTTTDCANAFADSTFTCTSTTSPVTATITLEPYEMEVTIPVPDDSDLLAGQDINREIDGYDPCARVGVRIEREREYLFGAVAGFDSARPAADAVGRVTSDGQRPEYATLVLLDPHGCEVVRGDGNGIRLLIENITVDGDTFPGIITLDSDASECGNLKYLINPNGDDSRICAGVNNATDVLDNDAFCDSSPDTLLSEADGADVAAPDDLTDERVAPDPPIRRGRVTRQPIDHRYNCRADYYTPGYGDVTGQRQFPRDEGDDDTDVTTCATAGRPAHVDELVDAYGSAGVADFQAMGFTIITGSDCTPGGVVTYPAGNYYADCTQGQDFKLQNGATVTFEGPGTIVFAENVNNNGILRINTAAEFDDDDNPATGLDSLVFVQDGDIDDTGGGGSTATELFRTFVYLETGVVSLQQHVEWEAPRDNPYDRYDDSGSLVEPGPCDDGDYSGAPPPACFQNLALWSNSGARHDLAAQAGIVLDGIFFTPAAGYDGAKADFKLHGGPGYQLDHAQFFTYQLSLAGGSQLTMRPDPERFEETPILGGGLIR